jgi:hypothetical protein
MEGPPHIAVFGISEQHAASIFRISVQNTTVSSDLDVIAVESEYGL